MAVGEGTNVREFIDFVNESGIGTIGTPDDAVEQIDRLWKQSNGGFGAYLQLAHDWADPAAKWRSFELFARHVAPRFQGQYDSTVDAKARARAPAAEAGREQHEGRRVGDRQVPGGEGGGLGVSVGEPHLTSDVVGSRLRRGIGSPRPLNGAADVRSSCEAHGGVPGPGSWRCRVWRRGRRSSGGSRRRGQPDQLGAGACRSLDADADADADRRSDNDRVSATTTPPAEGTTTSTRAETPPTTVPKAGPSTSVPARPSTSVPADTLSTDEIAFMLTGAFGRLLQRNDLAGVGPALDAVLAQPLPSDVTIDHPLDGPQPLDEFLETMRRRVDDGNFGQPPAAAVRAEVLLMADAGLLPGLPPTVADGVHTVGVDVVPGLYVIWDVAECSWAHLNSDGDVLDRNFVRRSPRAEVRIFESDHAFESEHCGRWIKLD